MAEPNLEELRDRIRQIDHELVAGAAERVRLVRQVGEIKRRLKLSTVDSPRSELSWSGRARMPRHWGFIPASRRIFSLASSAPR